MPKATKKTGITEAAEALRNASKKLRLTPELEASLQQLDSIVHLLGISKLSQATFERLASLLRQRLLPLHRTLPILGLRYSAAVLVTIFDEKIQPAVKAGYTEIKEAWEVVQAALLSGVLDFLEENSSRENQTIVATTFYPILHNIFFRQFTRLAIDHGSDLMYTLYSLLSETVTSHAANQSKLRSQDLLGSKCLGAILSRTQDFLVIEALLELFVKILPPKTDKDGQESRMSFIQEVFSPATFACSSEILAFFKSLSTGDWEDIFLQLLSILARANEELPQPFEISDFRIHGSKPYLVERIYVDRKGFLANIDEDGQLETFQAMYLNVQHVKVSILSKVKTSVIVQLSYPPMVGISAVPESSDGRTLVSFDVHGKDISRFLKALKSRNLNDVTVQTGRKLSKAETTVEFDFDSKGKDLPVSTQDRARDLTRLWDINNSWLYPGVAPTSPLSRPSPSVRLLTQLTLSRKSAPVSDDEPSKSPPTTRHRQTSAEYDSVFGSTGEELTDFSGNEAETNSHRLLKSPSIKQHYSGRQAPIILVVDSEAEEEAPKTRKRRTKKIILVSDDDDEEEIEELDVTTLKTPGRRKPGALMNEATITSKGTSPPEIEFIERSSGPMRPASTTATQTLRHQKNSLPFAVTSNIADKSTINANGITNSSSKNFTPSKVNSAQIPLSATETGECFDEEKSTRTVGKKRKLLEEPIPEADLPSPKRLREEPQDTIEAKAATRTRKPVPKRYGRKGRTSSPAPSVIHDIDFNELPVPSTDHAAESKPNGKRKGRVSAMKGKDGKAASKAKIVPAKVKKEVNDQQDAIRLLTKGKTTRAKKETMEERPEVKPAVQVVHDETGKPTRRSARVAKITGGSVSNDKNASTSDVIANGPHAQPVGLQSEALPQTAPPQKKAPQEQKPQLAPWQDVDFLQKIATSSDDPQDRAVSLANDNLAEILSDTQDPDPKGNEPAPTSDETTGETEDQYEDYFIPTKLGSTSLEVDEPKNDAVMIDLTRDSPEPLSRVMPRASPIHRRESHIELPKIRPFPVRQRLPEKQFVIHSSPKVDRPHVSFAPPASSRPSLVFDWTGETEASSIRARDGFISLGDRRLFHGRHRYGNKFQDANDESNAQVYEDHKTDPISGIIDIIGEITQVVLQKTSRRFDDVRKDLRAGQKSILLETSHELENMVSESTDHFNNLINLESEYATHHRKIVDGLEDLFKIEQEVSRFLTGTIQEHNRSSLSRKFSSNLFSSPPPAIIGNPKLIL